MYQLFDEVNCCLGAYHVTYCELYVPRSVHRYKICGAFLIADRCLITVTAGAVNVVFICP